MKKAITSFSIRAAALLTLILLTILIAPTEARAQNTITNTTGDLTLTAGGDYIVNGHVTITGNLIIQGCGVSIDFGEPSGILSSSLTVTGTVSIQTEGSLSFGGARVAVYSNFGASPKEVESIIDNDTPYTAGEIDALSGKTFTAIPSGYWLVKFSDGDIRIKRPGDGNNFKTKDNADFKMGSDYCFVADGNTKVELRWEHLPYVAAFDKMGDARFTVKDGDGTAVSVTYGYEGGNGNHRNASFTMPASSDVTVSVRACVPVTYIDGNGAAQVCRDYTLMPTYRNDYFYYNDQKYGSDWYMSIGVTVDKTGYCLSFNADSDVHLILCDGTTTTVNVNGDHALICGGLTIYGQSDGTGTLTLNTDNIAIKAYSTLTICGGSVSATSGNREAIEVDGDIIVKGGTLTACANNGESKAIYCRGTLRLSGGTVAATKGAIYTRDGATIAAGLAYTDGRGHYYTGSISYSDLLNLGAVTLTPLPAVTLNETDGVTTLVSHAGEAVGVMFTRSFTGSKASTLCLPYDFAPTGGTFYTFDSVDENWTTVTMKSTDPDNRAVVNNEGKLLANTPYLFKPAADGQVDFTGTIANVASSYAAGTTTPQDSPWTFTGTYEEKRWDDTNNPDGRIFGFATGQGYEGKDASTDTSPGDFIRLNSGGIKPFRAYLKYTGNLARTRGEGGLPERMTVRLVGANGEIQGIGEIRLSTGEVTFDSNAWFDLNGRRLDGQPSEKGIYINGGRKVVIK